MPLTSLIARSRELDGIGEVLLRRTRRIAILKFGWMRHKLLTIESDVAASFLGT